LRSVRPRSWKGCSNGSLDIGQPRTLQTNYREGARRRQSPWGLWRALVKVASGGE
jgi:hypothetical protein